MKSFRFNRKQLDRISEYSSNASLVAVASIIIPELNNHKISIIPVVTGTVITIGLFAFSISIIRR